jgi:hypothetical protein
LPVQFGAANAGTAMTASIAATTTITARTEIMRLISATSSFSKGAESFPHVS